MDVTLVHFSISYERCLELMALYALLNQGQINLVLKHGGDNAKVVTRLTGCGFVPTIHTDFCSLPAAWTRRKTVFLNQAIIETSEKYRQV